MIACAIFVVCRRAAPAVVRLRFQPSVALCLRTSGLNQCCMILYLHCLVFREHRAALSSQLLYLTSSSGSCQELFSEVFRSPGAPSAPWRLSPAGLASPVCRRLFADDLYYITRFFRTCQYVFAKLFLSLSAYFPNIRLHSICQYRLHTAFHHRLRNIRCHSYFAYTIHQHPVDPAIDCLFIMENSRKHILHGTTLSSHR